MRTGQQNDNLAPYLTPLVPDGPAAEHDHSGNPGSREDIARRLTVPPRSPSNPGSGAESAAMILDEADEILVEDARAGVTPAEMVEQKLRSLLRTRGISIELAGRARPVRGR